MRKLFLKKLLLIVVILFISSCSLYRQPDDQYPLTDLKKLHSHYVTLPNGKIEYYRFGRGSPIVLVSGYVTDVSSWNREFLAGLAKNHDVIVFNNRNVGGTQIHSNRYESKDLAKDTYALIEKLNLKKPAVLGFSMGGMIAQQVAVLYQDKLGELILVNTAIAGNKAVHPHASVEHKMLHMPKNILRRYGMAIDLCFPRAWKLKMAYALAVDRFQPQNYKAINPAPVMPLQQKLIMHWSKDENTAQKIEKLKLPVLVLNGESDVIIPPQNSEILAHTIPNAKLVRFKEGGHAMIYQFPAEIAATINHFLFSSSR